MEIKKNKPGRPKGEPKETISFKVPTVIKEEVKKQVKPIIEKIVKKLLPILLIVLASCGKEADFVKVRVEQAGELIRVFGYLEKPAIQPHRYVINARVCGHARELWVDIAAGRLEGFADYQDNCKVEGWTIVYDDILRQ